MEYKYFLTYIILLAIIGHSLSITKQTLEDFDDPSSEQQFEQKTLSQFTLQYKFSDDKQWKQFGQMKIIRNYKEMNEKIAIKQDAKLKTLRQQLKNKDRLFFKIDKSCNEQQQTSMIMNSIPTSFLQQSDLRMSMNIAFTSNECSCIKGMSFKTSNKLRKGNLKGRIFLQTKSSIATLVKSPTLTHKQYDMNGKFVEQKRSNMQNEQPPQSFLQRYWMYILIGVVVFSMMNAGAQQPQQG